MGSKEVSLVRNCKTPEGWRYYSVMIGKNRRVRPNWVLVKGEPKEYPEGCYAIRYYEGSKTCYEQLDCPASEAIAQCEKFARELDIKVRARASGIEIVDQSVIQDSSRKAL